jgi:hypothetical protein
MSNGQSPQDQEHENTLRELKRAKELADAYLAAFKARFGDVPASQYKGEVTLEENAGKAEATLLAAQAVRSAAAAIVENINQLETKPTKVTLLATPDVPAFDNLLRFNVEIGIVRKAFDTMDAASSDAKSKEPADDAGQRPVPKMRAPVKQRAVLPVAAAGLALEAADKLLGFFRTDYTVGGIDVTVEDATLVNELAGLLTRNKCTVYLPKVFTREIMQASEDLMGEFETLAQRRTEGVAAADEHERLARKWTDAGTQESDKKKKEEMSAAAEAHTHAADVAYNAIALYDSWFDKLSFRDEKTSVVPIVAVIRERSMMDALSNGRSLLITHIHASGGSYYAKKNIWTVFGGMPFFHMGGIVASFVLLDGETGAVAAAGTVPVHGGFIKATRLENEIATRPGPPARRSWLGRIFRTTGAD